MVPQTDRVEHPAGQGMSSRLRLSAACAPPKAFNEWKQSLYSWTSEVRALPAYTRVHLIDSGDPGTQMRSSWDKDRELDERFSCLAETWRQETRGESSIDRMVAHPAYTQIIAMGERSLPLILRELEDHPDHWFPALFAISGQDAATGTTTFEAAVAAWLRWGSERGHRPAWTRAS